MNTEPQTTQNAQAAPIKRSISLGQRVAEWLWSGRALAAEEQSLPARGERANLFAERAWSSHDIAEATLAPDEPQEILADASATELFRQSVYWALCAVSADGDAAVGREYRESVWGTLDETLLSNAVKDRARLELARNALENGSFVFFAELPRAELLVLRSELSRLSDLALAKLDARRRALSRIYVRRVWRLGLLVLVAVALVGGWLSIRAIVEERTDLALGKPWSTSSRLSSGGCTSPAQRCSESPGFFFHTSEERNPWVEFDLGAPHELSKVVVRNRKDCCTERAIPLLVEVSTDHQTWSQVARQDAEFTTWRTSFAPRDRALGSASGTETDVPASRARAALLSAS